MRSLVLAYFGLIIVYCAIISSMIGLSTWRSDAHASEADRLKAWVRFWVLVPAAVGCAVAIGLLDKNLSVRLELLITGVTLLFGIGALVLDAGVDSGLMNRSKK